jgi:predicted CXXCH cytochrome family protein
LTSALLVIALPASAEFSHKVHLAQKLTCVSCHASAPSSAKAADNNLPGEQICSGCHKDSVSIKKPSTGLVTKFNHQLHVKLGNIAPVIAAAIKAKTYLGDPSHIASQLNTKNACITCHGTDGGFPAMAGCLTCHSQIDPPFSCVKCHDQNAKLKPDSHSKDFLERHSRKGVIQDRQTCAVCHGRNFTCLGCH